MDVTTYNIFVSIFNGQFGCGSFKITNVFNRSFYTVFNPLGQRVLLAPHFDEKPIHNAINQYQKVVAVATQLGEPFSILNGDIKNIAVEKPRLFPVEFQNELVHNFKIAH